MQKVKSISKIKMRARRLMAGHTTFNREHGGSNPLGRIQTARICKILLSYGRALIGAPDFCPKNYNT